MGSIQNWNVPFSFLKHIKRYTQRTRSGSNSNSDLFFDNQLLSYSFLILSHHDKINPWHSIQQNSDRLHATSSKPREERKGFWKNCIVPLSFFIIIIITNDLYRFVLWKGVASILILLLTMHCSCAGCKFVYRCYINNVSCSKCTWMWLFLLLRVYPILMWSEIMLSINRWIVPFIITKISVV